MKLWVQFFEKFGWEYKITTSTGIVCCSTKYDVIDKSEVVLSDIHSFDGKYYDKKETSLEEDSVTYEVYIYEDVTKYADEILKSKIDHLTQLPNRTYLENYLSSVTEECVIVMSDIDNFKKINDIYGHQSGDSVIRLIGDLIRCMIDRDAFAGRYGGEEFLIVFNTSDQKSVKNTMDQFNKFLEKYTKDLKISVSTGIYKYDPKTHEPISDAIKKADQALYYVKQHGKRASMIYDDMISIKK